MAEFSREKKSKSFLLNETLQKILNLINIAVIGIFLGVILFIGIAGGSTHLMSKVKVDVIDRFIQANPDLLSDISKRIDKQTTANMLNRLLAKEPEFLNEYINHLDPSLIAGAINEVNRKNPKFVSHILNDLDARAMGNSFNAVIYDNRLFINSLFASIDETAVAGAANSAIKTNPTFVNDVARGLDSKLFAESFNKVIYDQRNQAGTFIGAVDVKAVGTLVDLLIKEQPDTMAALMNQLMKLARTSLYSTIEIEKDNETSP